MAKVLGIGGVFFKAENGEAVGEWYRRVLGVDVSEWGGAMFPPLKRGYQVWSPFKADTNYFDPSRSTFMINFVVDDLDGVLETALAAGVEPLDRNDEDPSGRFAWLMDPAGVKIELWEPPEADPVS
ncbi:VOC family protein [Phenylobacterium sp. VNQ135]|uniref:VOC family protein n=1 Tax=Phenylobacterium sp. VNQ135 TaxID=3400922 RepID=UPI003C03471C